LQRESDAAVFGGTGTHRKNAREGGATVPAPSQAWHVQVVNM